MLSKDSNSSVRLPFKAFYLVLTRSRRVVGSNPIWNSDFFRVDVFTLIISLKKVLFLVVVFVLFFSANQTDFNF